MRVTFDWALDGTGWPGPLHGRGWAFGEAWVGRQRLLGILELRLGLAGRFDEPFQRACRLAARLRGQGGYWSASFGVDPLATSRRLLEDRDELRLWGWRGQPVSPRLAELHAATSDASPGIVDRLETVVATLASRTSRASRTSTGIESIATYTAIAQMPPLWRSLFENLRRAGVQIDSPTLPAAPAQGDLAAARAPRFSPQGDGRLSLLRRYGPLDVADEIAAALAASDSLDDVVIIGADTILDQALARHGLPRTGAHASPTASSRLLSLVVEAAFHPMEAGSLHALLATDPGPIPRRVSAPLIRALQECPGRRTSEWAAALAHGLSTTGDDKKEDVEKRVSQLLMPVCARNEDLPVPQLRKRLEVLDAWAHARGAFVP